MFRSCYSLGVSAFAAICRARIVFLMIVLTGAICSGWGTGNYKSRAVSQVVNSEPGIGRRHGLTYSEWQRVRVRHGHPCKWDCSSNHLPVFNHRHCPDNLPGGCNGKPRCPGAEPVAWRRDKCYLADFDCNSTTYRHQPRRNEYGHGAVRRTSNNLHGEHRHCAHLHSVDPARRWENRVQWDYWHLHAAPDDASEPRCDGHRLLIQFAGADNLVHAQFNESRAIGDLVAANATADRRHSDGDAYRIGFCPRHYCAHEWDRTSTYLRQLHPGDGSGAGNGQCDRLFDPEGAEPCPWGAALRCLSPCRSQ